MKYKDLPLNSRFKFKFDGVRSWAYQKISEYGIECIKCPYTYNCIGQLFQVGPDNECFEADIEIYFND